MIRLIFNDLIVNKINLSSFNNISDIITYITDKNKKSKAKFLNNTDNLLWFYIWFWYRY